MTIDVRAVAVFCGSRMGQSPFISRQLRKREKSWPRQESGWYMVVVQMA